MIFTNAWYTYKKTQFNGKPQTNDHIFFLLSANSTFAHIDEIPTVLITSMCLHIHVYFNILIAKHI